MLEKTILHARYLRKTMTPAERHLWQMLRARRLKGYRFRKQAPMGMYVVDFICHEAKLIIELDGGHHNADVAMCHDDERTKWLNTQGYTVKRFWNDEVLKQLEAVLETILELCSKKSPPILSFPHKRRGEGTI